VAYIFGATLYMRKGPTMGIEFHNYT